MARSCLLKQLLLVQRLPSMAYLHTGLKLSHLTGNHSSVYCSICCFSSQKVSSSVKVKALDDDCQANDDSLKISDANITRDDANNSKELGDDQKHRSSNPENPDFNHAQNILLYYRPKQQLVNLDVKSIQNQMSIFLSRREELVDIQFSEKFRQTVKAINNEEEKNTKSLNSEEPPIGSIDEFLWKEMKFDKAQLPSLYLKLAKIRLTGLVVVTAMAGYALAPGCFDPATFLLVSLGTALISSSANAINQFLEVPFDSQMNRTKNRPLVKGMLSPLHAAGFAATTAVSGTALLGLGVNPLTAALGVFNLVLYTSVYTPMKRLSIANTWVGSVVGAVPPLMGWAAACGTLHSGAWTLAAIMFAWQFPHFCALSWNLRPDYSRAGYRMMSVVDPGLCKHTALRYSIGMIGLCMLVPYCDVTTWVFAVDSLPLNAWLAYLGWQFYRQGDSKSSRRLFRFSLVHIPALIILMLISKKHHGDQNQTKDAETNSP